MADLVPVTKALVKRASTSLEPISKALVGKASTEVGPVWRWYNNGKWIHVTEEEAYKLLQAGHTVEQLPMIDASTEIGPAWRRYNKGDKVSATEDAVYRLPQAGRTVDQPPTINASTAVGPAWRWFTKGKWVNVTEDEAYKLLQAGHKVEQSPIISAAASNVATDNVTKLLEGATQQEVAAGQSTIRKVLPGLAGLGIGGAALYNTSTISNSPSKPKSNVVTPTKSNIYEDEVNVTSDRPKLDFSSTIVPPSKSNTATDEVNVTSENPKPNTLTLETKIRPEDTVVNVGRTKKILDDYTAVTAGLFKSFDDQPEYKEKYEKPLNDIRSKMDETRKVFSQAIDNAKTDADREKVNTQWAQVADSFATAIGQIVSGAIGVQRGVDLSGMKFNQKDWSDELNRIGADLKTKLGIAETNFGLQAGRLSDQEKSAMTREMKARELYERGETKKADIARAQMQAALGVEEAKAKRGQALYTAQEERNRKKEEAAAGEKLKRDLAKLGAETKTTIAQQSGAIKQEEGAKERELKLQLDELKKEAARVKAEQDAIKEANKEFDSTLKSINATLKSIPEMKKNSAKEEASKSLINPLKKIRARLSPELQKELDSAIITKSTYLGLGDPKTTVDTDKLSMLLKKINPPE